MPGRIPQYGQFRISSRFTAILDRVLGPQQGGGNSEPEPTPERVLIAATRGNPCAQGTAGTIATSDVGTTYRVKHTTPSGIKEGQLVFANSQLLYNGENNGPNAITVKASIELMDGTIIPVTFDGQATVTIAPGGRAVSDKMTHEFAEGAEFYSRTWVHTAAASQSWPVGTIMRGYSEGTASGDATASGTFTSSTGFAYSPYSIIGKHKTKKPAILCIGDSISKGLVGSEDNSYVNRAIGTAANYIVAARSGLYISALLTQSKRAHMEWLADYATSIYIALGTNDLNGATNYATVKGNMDSLISIFTAKNAKLIYATILPRTVSSSDLTPYTNYGGPTSVRGQLNTYIMSKPAGVDAAVDLNPNIETGQDTSVWVTGATADGTHPNYGTWHQAISANLPVSLFV
ncbi:hypothetical protein D3C81_683120 [compost metagenome]